MSDPTPGQAPGTPESEVSDLTKELDESKLILEDTGLSTPISESSENTTNNIESQRASKEALYMKLREEIFENNNEEEEGGGGGGGGGRRLWYNRVSRK